MFIPLGSDAPAYHRPWGTLAIIAGTVLVFGFFDLHSVADRRIWTLECGRFLPWQWVTSAFSHAGPLHLIGNVIFLAVFGVIVEGKIGVLRFVPLYLAIAAAEGFVTQVVMLGTDPVHIRGIGQVYPAALGASGVIYGLMAISFLWAPRNEVRCLFLMVPRAARTFRVRVSTLCGLYIGWDLLLAAGILVRRLERPAAGLRCLEALDATALTEAQRKKAEALVSLAKREIERGVIELSDDS